MTELSDTIRAQICLLHEEGYSVRHIAHRMKVSIDGVQCTLRRFVQTASFKSLRRTGRPRATTAQTDRLIRRVSSNHPTFCSRRIQCELPRDVNVSRRTIRRRLLVDFKLRASRPARKPRLSAKNIRDRLIFCNKYKDFTPEDWDKFSSLMKHK